jgi:hypothetical protein
MVKSCGGGFSGQKFVPSTIMEKVIPMSSFCALKELVRSLLRLFSAHCNLRTLNSDNVGFTCEHALKLVKIFETTGLFEFGDYACFILVGIKAENQALGKLGGVQDLE